MAGLVAAVSANTAALAAAERRKDSMFNAVSAFTPQAASFGALPYAIPADAFGPKDGFAWAVQRVTVSGFGATSDLITIYRGGSLVEVQPQNALFTFAISAAGAVATWHPGRTGLVLKGNERLALGGTFTGTTGFISYDVIQVRADQLPWFLL
jgi:hypothetical protein